MSSWLNASRERFYRSSWAGTKKPFVRISGEILRKHCNCLKIKKKTCQVAYFQGDVGIWFPTLRPILGPEFMCLIRNSLVGPVTL